MDYSTNTPVFAKKLFPFRFIHIKLKRSPRVTKKGILILTAS